MDLTLQGHHHSYQRTCPVYNGSCVGYDKKTREALGPVHLVIGNGGGLLKSNMVQPEPKYLKVWLGGGGGRSV